MTTSGLDDNTPEDMFADRLIAATDLHGPLCIGIDPHPGRIPDLFGGDTPDGITRWGTAIIRAGTGYAGICKLQAGLFERHGWQGMRALATLCATARDAGMIVLADGKRGDIGSTAQGYAEAWLAEQAPFFCDALTVNPYMGIDTLEPCVHMACATGKGVIVLVRTSNPGSADFQTRSLDGVPLYIRVVDALAPMIERLKGTSGWSGLMLVCGATGPDEAFRIRQLAPDALFLVPGYGAQGAGAADALAGFVHGRGGCVNASRTLAFPSGSADCQDENEWTGLITNAIARAQDALKQAVLDQRKNT